MSQLSFFSAENETPRLTDLAGVLAAQGQVVTTTDGVRISAVLAAPWRAQALVAEVAATGLTAQIDRSSQDSIVVRTAASPLLTSLATQWTRGAVKAMPDGWVPSPRALRMWVIVAGSAERRDSYLLGLDPHASDYHAALATALMRAGIAPTLVGTHSGPLGLRITGRKRLARLAETVGAIPATLAASEAVHDWPRDPWDTV